MLVGPIKIKPTQETLKWCAWPYEKHPRGCPSHGKGRLGCPGHPQTKYYEQIFNPWAYLVAVFGDWGAYLVSREIASAGKKYSPKELKNKRWYQGTLVAALNNWMSELTHETGSVISKYKLILNGEAIGINFSQVCEEARIPVYFLDTKTEDYAVIKPSFNDNNRITLEELVNLARPSNPVVVENYYQASLPETKRLVSDGNWLPMARLGILAAPK